MAINYNEFNNYIDDVIQEFKTKETGIDPLDLIKKLKWLS